MQVKLINKDEFVKKIDLPIPLDETYCDVRCPYNTDKIHPAWRHEKRVCALFSMSMYFERGGKNKRTERCLEYFGEVKDESLKTKPIKYPKPDIIFVLKEPTKHKLTIYELTENELKELVDIATNNSTEIASHHYRIVEYDCIEYNEIRECTPNVDYKLTFRIYENFDFELILADKQLFVKNQVKLRKRLNEILSGVE